MRALVFLLALTATAHAQAVMMAPPINRQPPAPVAGLGRATAIADVFGTSCALVDGAVWCWGQSMFAEDAADSATPTKLHGLAGIVQFSISPSGGCGRNRAGVVTCWGYGFDLVRPAHVRGLGRAKKVSVGPGFGCALLVDGHVACWGLNSYNELGQPLAVPRPPRRKRTLPPSGKKKILSIVEPVRLGPKTEPEPAPNPEQSAAALRVPGLDGVVDIAAGKYHVCAVRASGEVVCWGDRYRDTAEDGTHRLIRSGARHRIPGIDDAIAVSADDRDSCALRRNGRVSCWAENSDDPLTGPCEYRGLDDAVALADHALYAVTKSGAVVPVSGWNDCSREPPEPGVTGAVAAGQNCALVGDGRVVCWGTNQHGELGRPPTPFYRE